MTFTTLAAATASAPPAGGAALGQVFGATLAATIMTAALLYFGMGHRTGRTRVLGRLATFAGRRLGMPGWAALPVAIAAGSLLCAVFGLYWDVSLHIDNGRDSGPLANPSHYFILVGLFGIFTAGWLAIVLPEGRPGPAAIRIRRDWHAPVGGVMFMACAAFALGGFPLDDVSHRLFGQDVTLWGPTHLMMLGGAAMTLIAILVILAEARLAQEAAGDEAQPYVPAGLPAVARRVLEVLGQRRTRTIFACGGLLIGLSIFQGEFDYGVPQFRLLYHPVLIALAAGVGLTAARILAGRGAALAAVVFFIVVRGALTLIVTGALGQSVGHFPLYLAEALLVEGVAFAVSPRNPYRFGIASGVLIGTLGVLAEYGWSHAWMPLPWPSHLLPAAIALALPVAVAGGVLGAFLAGALRLRRDVAVGPRARLATGLSFAVIAAAIIALGFTTVPPKGTTAEVTLRDVAPAPHRTATATVRFHPASVTHDADWVAAIAWQGRGKVISQPMRRIGDGVYRTTSPLPLYGEWKAYLRLHKGRILAGVPVYLPADPAIPVAGLTRPAHFTAGFTGDHKLLQRERKDDVPAWLWGLAGAVVLACSLALLGMLGWGLTRLTRTATEGAAEERRRAAPGSHTGDRAVAGVV